MDNHSAPLWPPPASSAPFDFPPIRGGAARPEVARTRPRDVNAFGGDGLLIAAGEGILSLAPSFSQFGASGAVDQHSGEVAGTGYAMQGMAHVGKQTPFHVQARQPSLPMLRLGPQAKPLISGWVFPVAAVGHAGYPVRDRHSSHLHGQDRGLPMGVNASGPFAHLVAVARGQLGEMEAQLGSMRLPVMRTPTAFSFDWKGDAQQQAQRDQTAWPDQGRHQQEQLPHRQQSQDRMTPGSMNSSGLFGGHRNVFASPSWTPELHTSHAASMITPEFSPNAWDNDGGSVQRGASSDGDAVTSMASISPFTSQSPANAQDGHSVLPDALAPSQDREDQIMLGTSSSPTVDAAEAQWLSASRLVPRAIDLFTTPEEKERQAEASLDIASRTTVDEELLWSLGSPMEMNSVVQEPPSPQPASAPWTPAKASQPLSTLVPPSKTVVVPGLSLNTTPQYRRMSLAEILNDSDSRDNDDSRRRSRKPRKQGTRRQQQPARKPRFNIVGAASKRTEVIANAQKCLLPKPDAATVAAGVSSRLSPAYGRVGNAIARTDISGNPALHPTIPRTQPSIPPVKAQRRPRGGAKPQRAKSAAAPLKRQTVAASAAPQGKRNKGDASSPAQRAPMSFPDPASAPQHSTATTAATQCASGPSAAVSISLQPCRTKAAPVRVDASSCPGSTTKKRRRNETGQTQRMKLAAQMMEEALRGVGAGGVGSHADGNPQQHLVPERSGSAALAGNLTSGDSSAVNGIRVNGGCDAARPPTGCLNVHASPAIAPGASLGLFSPVKQGFGATCEAAAPSQSASSLESVHVPGDGLAGTFDHRPVAAEPLPTAANSTVVVFCKRDFMRYQAAKIWRKYQEQLQKQEWRPVRVEGKRTRFLNPKYDMLVHKAKSRTSKARPGPRNGLVKHELDASHATLGSVDTSGRPPSASTECAG